MKLTISVRSVATSMVLLLSAIVSNANGQTWIQLTPGATISGDVSKIVIVKTNAGYGPSPGQTGTGTVVAKLCGS